MNPLLRPMQAADLPTISRIYQAANSFAHISDIEEWTTESLRVFPQYHLVCCEGEKIIGGISGTVDAEGNGWIEDIALLPSWRRKNIGELLLQPVLQKFREAKISRVLLWVHWRSASAIPFYQKNGFHLQKFFKTKNIPSVPEGEDVILFEKSFLSKDKHV